MQLKVSLFLVFCIAINHLFINQTYAVYTGSYISTNKSEGSFTLVSNGIAAPIIISKSDFPGVVRIAGLFKNDIKMVSSAEAAIVSDEIPQKKELVIIGTIGKNQFIDRLVENKKLNVSDIKGKWETYLIEVVKNPFPDVEKALVIAGSDKRGTIFGMFDVSAKIGVSPWYYWADVPAITHKDLFVLPGRYTDGEPAVKYRGIFINDENPALYGWVKKEFGKFNHNFYEKVFELILRCKGNFLWPAMWGKAFYVEDTLNPVLADEYGIVIGTSHHEPMGRAHVEWKWTGKGPWDYEKNETILKEYWAESIRRLNGYESIITVGMRGDGDEPMSEESNIALLERIINDQRQILFKETGKQPSEITQVWALYKEVQDYYDKGMQVPEDITLMLCDDNWGNIRKLPKLTDKSRPGGYGVYYHFDYVGGPRNYKWINTVQIERVWEQMNLAYEYDARKIWIVNVGDIKPMEFPIEFFLDFAWNPAKWPADSLPAYYRLWAEQQFGNMHASGIAGLVSSYTRYNSRRKPELLSKDTYSLNNYREADNLVSDYKTLEEKALKINNLLPENYRDAFYQLVLHPIQASANLNELYVTVAKNHQYYSQGRAETNELAKKAKQLFDRDADITKYYNNEMAEGKWKHMMDQVHIGYVIWQQPDKNSIPETKKTEILKTAKMGITVEGMDGSWPNDTVVAKLPDFDIFNKQSYYFEIFNRGAEEFEYAIADKPEWLVVTPEKGTIEKQQKVWVKIDWEKIPAGKTTNEFVVKGPSETDVKIKVITDTYEDLRNSEFSGFVENNGYVSIESGQFSRAVNTNDIKWKVIPGLGRTSSAVTFFPVTSVVESPGNNSSHLEYDIYLKDTGNISLMVYLSPTLNYNGSAGLRYAVSVDNEKPVIINMHRDLTNKSWEKWVSDNVTIQNTQHKILKTGLHTIKFWAVDPGVVLQKIVIDTGGLKPSYLGPPESYRKL